MSELAFNSNREAFEVPAPATGWRVRRLRANGSPEVDYGRDGTPVVLPIDAVLLRAADGAGLPARKPSHLAELAELVPSDEDGEDTTTDIVSPTVELINDLVAQVIPIVVTSLISGKKLRKLASVLDWCKATPIATEDTTSEVEPSAAETSTPALDPKMMTRVIAAELSPAEMHAWFRELLDLSIPDAVAKISAIVNRRVGAA